MCNVMVGGVLCRVEAPRVEGWKEMFLRRALHKVGRVSKMSRSEDGKLTPETRRERKKD